MNELISYGMGKIADRIPGFLRRKLFPVDQVREQIKVELRGDAPITPWVGDNAEIPYIDMYFEITNLSHLTITLDRLLIEVWYGQPLFDANECNSFRI